MTIRSTTDDDAYGQLLAPVNGPGDAADAAADGGPPAAAAPTLHDDVNARRRQVVRLEEELHASLVEAGRLGHAATLPSGAAQGTGRWIYSQYYVGRRFTETEYREALRSRVLSTFEPPLGRGAIVCHCGANGGVGYDLVQEPLHPTICKWNGHHIVNKRHQGGRGAPHGSPRAVVCHHPRRSGETGGGTEGHGVQGRSV